MLEMRRHMPPRAWPGLGYSQWGQRWVAKGMIEGRNRFVQSPWETRMKGACEHLERLVDVEERLRLRLRTFDVLFVVGFGGPTL